MSGDKEVRISFQDQMSLNHRGRGVGSMGGVPPPTFRFKSRRVLKMDPVSDEAKDGDQHKRDFTLFSPRSVNGVQVDALDESAEEEHYTPDWFKMSIRCVDRENAEQEIDEETVTVCEKIEQVLKLRDKWLYKPANSNQNHIGATLVCDYHHILSIETPYKSPMDSRP